MEHAAMPASRPEPQYITPAQLVLRWGSVVKLQTLANWRANYNPPRGPAFVKEGHNVFYPLQAVKAWESQHMAIKLGVKAANDE